MFQVGDRVVTAQGELGHIKAIDADLTYCDVRLVTPNDEPSCYVTMTTFHDLNDGANVLPQPRSKAWWQEAREFQRTVEWILRDAGI